MPAPIRLRPTISRRHPERSRGIPRTSLGMTMLARTRKPTRETPVPTLFSYSPESVDYFGAALLEFAKMNRGQARQEQGAGLG